MSSYTVRRVHDRGQPSLCRETRAPGSCAERKRGKLALFVLAVILMLVAAMPALGKV